MMSLLMTYGPAIALMIAGNYLSPFLRAFAVNNFTHPDDADPAPSVVHPGDNPALLDHFKSMVKEEVSAVIQFEMQRHFPGALAVSQTLQPIPLANPAPK